MSVNGTLPHKGKPRVAITGMAMSTALGDDLAVNIASWWEGRTHFKEASPESGLAGTSVKYAGECPEPAASKLPDRKVKKILTRKDVIGMVTALQAAADAGIKPGSGNFSPDRFGMYVGAGSTQIKDLTPYFPLVRQCVTDGVFDSARFGTDMAALVNPMVVLQTLMNNTLCFTSIALDLRGVNSNFMDFNVSGLRAVGEAFRSIQHGRAELCLAGGIASPVEPFHIGTGINSGYLAKTAELGLGASEVLRPYDDTRCGTVLSEGAAFLLLEREDHAKARGARIWGYVDGYACASDGPVEFMKEEHAPGLSRSIMLACREADVPEGNRPDFVIGHGNGVMRADAVEIEACAAVLAPGTPMASIKAVTGELGEAAGVASCIAALDSLARGSVPPTFNFKSGERGGLRISSSPQKNCETFSPSNQALVTQRSVLGVSCSLILSGV
ncbi:MAG: 3-oxoacyl-[acyl-carrier-protein] synthase 2 [Pseudomonadota bacterium]